MTILSTNPATGESGRQYAKTSPDEAERILAAAAVAFEAWREQPLAARAEIVRAAAVILRTRQEEFARLMAVEMGKPIVQGRGEVEKCAWVCEHYADHGARYLDDEVIASDAARSYVHYEPLGVVLAIMPWNFPLWQVFRFAAPALVAGNGAILKHASNVPGCALAIESILHEAGVPTDLFRALLVDVDSVAGVIASPHVQAVTLTGSTPAGRAVASAAGQALKKTVLELGGSDPYLVLEDADVEVAAQACVTGRVLNSGQSCIAAKRWIVVDSIRAAFEERVVALMSDQRVGNPLDETTQIGPMAREDLRDELHEQVQASLRAGARVLLGGDIPEMPGAWYPPTILTDVAHGMPAYGDELFGPVAAIVPVRDTDEAIRVANDTCFGLGAAVFTRDVARGEEIAATRLHAGACFVNAFVRSDPRLPFGGIKDSGYGRELGGLGIREFVNAKTVYVA